MHIKIHKKLGRGVVAVCDDDLIGKSFEENGLSLDVKPDFYMGEKKTKEEIKDILINATNINIVGKESVSLCLELGIITKENITKIKGIPHAQSVIL